MSETLDAERIAALFEAAGTQGRRATESVPGSVSGNRILPLADGWCNSRIGEQFIHINCSGHHDRKSACEFDLRNELFEKRLTVCLE